MIKLGFALSSEEHPGTALIAQAHRAEEVGFSFALISDHFHPWIDQQGHSPFVWSVLGGIARETQHLRVGTGVTCPLIRIHPAIVAHAAATTAELFGDRFFLGIGAGERLNEHILADRWPPAPERLDMLEEAVDVIRQLWEGGQQSYEGRFYELEDARIYTLPPSPPPVYMATTGRRGARMAARIADGLISIAPQRELVELFERAGGSGKPRIGQVHVCWAASQEKATEMAMKWWPTAALPGVVLTELATPTQFMNAARVATPQMLAEQIALGPDPERHLRQIRSFSEAGFDHVYVHQIGPDQEGFFRFYEREILPQVGRLPVGARA